MTQELTTPTPKEIAQIENLIKEATASSQKHTVLLKQAGNAAVEFSCKYRHCDYLNKLRNGLSNNDKAMLNKFLSLLNKDYGTLFVMTKKLNEKEQSIAFTKNEKAPLLRDSILNDMEKVKQLEWISKKETSSIEFDFFKSFPKLLQRAMKANQLSEKELRLANALLEAHQPKEAIAA